MTSQTADERPTPQIVDVIAKTAYSRAFYYIVVDRPVHFIYERTGRLFVGRHGDFYDFLSGTDRKGEAFGGRSFDIELTDGSKFHCNGDVWAVGAPKGFEPAVRQEAVSTLAQLKECYVFCSASISTRILNDWLATHEPSTDYYKYERKHGVAS